jgi:hypothetical protein
MNMHMKRSRRATFEADRLQPVGFRAKRDAQRRRYNGGWAVAAG